MKPNYEPRFELDPKITEDEILAASHSADDHIGNAEHFNSLLNFLVNLGAFGHNITAPRVADLIYAPSSLLEPTDSQEKAGKPPTHWGNRRFEKLRYGKASFTTREASYFHQVFRRTFGEEWANLITVEELILTPLKETLNRLRQSNLPGPWSRLDPVQVLHILEAGQAGKSEPPSIFITNADETRLTHQGDSNIEHLKSLDNKPKMPIGSRYFIHVEYPDETKQACLAFEYTDHPMQIEGKTQMIQGQMLHYRESHKQEVRFTSKGKHPLVITDHPGNFGFCVIAFPKEWDPKEAFLLPSSGLLGVHDMQGLVKRLREWMLKDAPITISLYDYVVPPTAG